ncbi:MAG: ABC transporter substrate-binding protein [Erysipelotrichaceae bacterium]
MKRFIAVLCLIACAFLLLGCEKGEQPDSGSNEGIESPVSGKKVAYIMQMAASDIFEMWSDSAKETAEKLGMEYDVYFCDGSDAKWQETVSKCAADGYDGLLLSHGGKDYAYTFLKGLLEEYPELKIVTFDTLFVDEDGQTKTLDGVTQFFQQDAQFTELLLDYVCEELYPEKTEAVNILKVWIGPNYISAFDRRETGYAAYEEAGLINTVETICPADFDDVEASMAEVTKTALEKYQPGEIDAIWCCYDLYARGVYKALVDGGYDIPMVSVDICNADIEKMAFEASPWKACATTNWNYNGEFGMRILALELTDDYDSIIDPMTNEISSWLELPTTVVTQQMVSKEGVNVTNLDEVAGSSYTNRDWMPSAEWMVELLGD